MPTIRFGFAPDGSFVACDDAARVGAFAYPSSHHATAAKRIPARVAARMLWESNFDGCPDRLREEHYARACQSLANN